MEKEHVRVPLLADEEGTFRPEENAMYPDLQPSNWFYRHGGRLFLTVVLLSSLGINVFTLLQNHQVACTPDIGRSEYSGLGYDTPTTYHASTDYWGDNETLADELWQALDTDPIIVALPDEYAEGHGLKKSGRFPWDDEKGIYFLKGFHDLHCLKLMRRAFVDYQRGNEQLLPQEHIHHCLDGLRQDIMCKADDTPMPSSNIPHHVGDGQVLQCRDWNKLVAWTQDPERNACHKMLSDYRPISHSLERHAFCPENSPYYSTMKSYFEVHGHKDPWE